MPLPLGIYMVVIPLHLRLKLSIRGSTSSPMAKDKISSVANQQTLDDIAIGSQVIIDLEKEKKLVRKLDMYLIPIYMITYISAVLDRSIIGNAKIAGLTEDLHLVNSEYNGKPRYLITLVITSGQTAHSPCSRCVHLFCHIYHL